jgi:hypothetical protein
MEQPGLTQIGEDRCANLRWKGLFIDAVWDPTVQPSNDRAFWCQHTLNCLGPDGKVCDHDDCQPGRECYQPL